MPLDLSTFDVMSYLWETMDKTSEGNIRYALEDVDALWHMGFVDTESITLETWRSVFEPFRQADGTFHVNRDGFLALEKYRYQGEIHVPFDASLINEGRYTDEGLADLFRHSIRPSVNLDNASFNTFLETLKTDCREAGGLIRIGKDAKLRIKQLIDRSPSPLRNLELMFDQMMRSQEATATVAEFEEALDEEGERKQTREGSIFTATPTSRSEAHARELTALTKAKTKSATPTKGKTTELKKIKRSPRGIRG